MQTFRQKIFIGYGASLILVVLILAWAMFRILRLGQASGSILRENYRSIQAAGIHARRHRAPGFRRPPLPAGVSGAGAERISGKRSDQFWSRRNIDPFLEDLVVQEIADAVAPARERGVDAKQLLPEVEGLLLSSCKKIFNRMAEIDQGLRGKGYPKSVQRRSVDDKYNQMKAFVEARIQAEIEMWRPKHWHEGWYETNKFWVWLIGTMLTLVGLLVKFF